MSKLLVILLTVELLAAFSLGRVIFLHRRDFERAFFTWHQHPTPESRLELDRQRHFNELHRLGFSAVVFGGMAVVTLLAVYAYNRRHRSEPAVQS